MTKGSVRSIWWKWEETTEEAPGGGYFPTFLKKKKHYAERSRYRGERQREQTGGSVGRGGASDFFRCPTFRRGGVNSGFSHSSQGQMLFFMQPELEQTPGTLHRQATSHAQHSLVIIGWAAWPHHSHVNIRTGRHFAWKPVINDLSRRKRCFGTCNVNTLKMTQQMQK